MWFLINTIVAVAIFEVGYLTCAIRVAIINSKEWKRDDD